MGNAQVFKCDALTLRALLPQRQTAHVRQTQRRQVSPQRDFNRPQVEFCTHTGQRRMRYIELHVQPAKALPGLIRQREPGRQGGERYPRYYGLDSALPGLNVIHVSGAELRIDRQRLCQTNGRNGKELQPMVAARIGQGEFNTPQDQRRRLTHLIQPVHRSLAYMHPPLPQQPVGKIAVGCGRINRNPAHIKMSVLRAPHPQYQSL